MNLESLLAEHASKFIDSKHPNKATHGITFDDSGSAWATDGIQLLRVGGFTDTGVMSVRDLKGRNLKVEPLNNWNHFLVESPVSAVIDVKQALEGAKMMQSILKAAKCLDKVDLIASEGELHIRFEEEILKGDTIIGKCEVFKTTVSINRLVSCLQVFDGHADKIELHEKYPRIQLSTKDVDVVLMAIKS